MMVAGSVGERLLAELLEVVSAVEVGSAEVLERGWRSVGT
jgi:hypothetical protein